MALPPGQRAVEGFPRFGTQLRSPPPQVPSDFAIEIAGAVTARTRVSLAELTELQRTEITADLHCVAGWSATDLRWHGVAFKTFYEAIIEPALEADATVTHVSFGGLDGYRSVVRVEDALGDDVLIADRLNGRPLDGDHGAPVRLVSPSQYGFISCKHLCRIELHTTDPGPRYHRSPIITAGLRLVRPHARARVWKEERHRYLPAWAVRSIYRRLIGPIRMLGDRPR